MTPFKFYVQKILPLAMDDSLSYYEVLLKVRDKLNEIGTALNDTTGTIQSLTGNFTELKNYVNEWFDNVNLDKETETAVNRLVSTGDFASMVLTSLASYMNPVFVPSVSQMISTSGMWAINSPEVQNLWEYQEARLVNTNLIYKGSVAAETDLPESPESGRDAYQTLDTGHIWYYAFTPGVWIDSEKVFRGSVTDFSQMRDINHIYVLTTNYHVYAWNPETETFSDTGIVYSVSNSSFIYRRQININDTPRTINLAGWYFYLFIETQPPEFPELEGKSGVVLCFDSLPNNYLILISITGECWLYNGSEWKRFPAVDKSLEKSGVPADAKTTGDTILEEKTQRIIAENALAAKDEELTERLDTIYHYGLTVYAISFLTQNGKLIYTQDENEIQGTYYSLKQDFNLDSSVLPANGKAVGDALNQESEERSAQINTLENLISLETERAQNAENALDSKIIHETERAQNAENALDSKIIHETERAQIAENALAAKDEELTERLDTIYDYTFTAYDISFLTQNGKLIYTQDENEIQGTCYFLKQDFNLDSSVLPANGKAVGDALNQESEERSAQINTLENLISVETERAQNAENALDSKIDEYESQFNTKHYSLVSQNGESIVTNSNSLLSLFAKEPEYNNYYILTNDYQLLITNQYNLITTETQPLSVKEKTSHPLEQYPVIMYGDSIFAGQGGSGYSQNGYYLWTSPNGRSWYCNSNGYCFSNLFIDYCRKWFGTTGVNHGMSGITSQELSMYGCLKNTVFPNSTVLASIGGNDGSNNLTTYDYYESAILKASLETFNSWGFDHNVNFKVCYHFFWTPSAQTDTRFQKGYNIYKANMFVREYCKKLSNVDYLPFWDYIYQYYYTRNADILGEFADATHPNDKGQSVYFTALCLALGLMPPNSPVYNS